MKLIMETWNQFVNEEEQAPSPSEAMMQEFLDSNGSSALPPGEIDKMREAKVAEVMVWMDTLPPEQAEWVKKIETFKDATKVIYAIWVLDARDRANWHPRDMRKAPRNQKNAMNDLRKAASTAEEEGIALGPWPFDF